VIGEAAWFRILEFLSEYMNGIGKILQDKITKQSVEDKHRIERVRDFIDQRKTMVLKNLP